MGQLGEGALAEWGGGGQLVVGPAWGRVVGDWPADPTPTGVEGQSRLGLAGGRRWELIRVVGAYQGGLAKGWGHMKLAS